MLKSTGLAVGFILEFERSKGEEDVSMRFGARGRGVGWPPVERAGCVRGSVEGAQHLTYHVGYAKSWQ